MFFENYSGYMRYERDNSIIYRPNGTTDYLFLYFPIPMSFDIKGKKFITEKDACVLFAPGEAHRFCAVTRFCNSFIHFDTDEDIKTYCSFQTGKIFYPANAKKINEIIKKVKDETLELNSHSDIMISSYITQILVLAERSFKDEECDELKRRFIKLRANMLANYSDEHNINDLASLMCMSRSRFYDYYKQFFNASPKQELLKIRMEAAQALLTNKGMTTSEIARETGFENVEHFTRYYKKHFGISPRRSR